MTPAPFLFSVDEGDADGGGYTVVLDTEPTADVTIAVDPLSGITVNPQELTLTAADWNDAQTVTVTGSPDSDAENAPSGTAHSIESDSAAEYLAVGGPLVIVIVNDDEAATVVTNTGQLSASDVVALDGTTFERAAAFTTGWNKGGYQLNSVGIRIHALTDPPPGEAASLAVAATVKTAAGSGSDIAPGAHVCTLVGPAAFSPSAVNRFVARPTCLPLDANTTYFLVLERSADSNRDIHLERTQSMSVDAGEAAGWSLVGGYLYWDGSAWTTETAHSNLLEVKGVAQATSKGVTITPSATPSAPLAVTEGGTGTYAVVLDAAPASDSVTVTVTAGVGVSTDVSELVFTTTDWGLPQTVTVTGVHDRDTADGSATITHAVDAASSDDDYDPVTISSVSVTVTDDDATPNLAATGTPTIGGTLKVGETLSVDTTGIADDEGLGVFTYQWFAGGVEIDGATSATYPLTAAEEGERITVQVSFIDGAGLHEALTSAATAAVAPADAAGVTLDPATLTVAEGATGEYTVVLNAEPSADVTVTVSSGAGVTTDVDELVFTSRNWSTAQTVTVSAAEDDDALNADVTITHAIKAGSATEYLAVSVGDVTVSVVDDDTAAVTVTPAHLGIVEGHTGTYTVVLDAQPAADVTVTVTAGTGVTVDASQLTFTAGDWDEPQEVMVSTAEDGDTAGATVTISHEVTTVSVPEYVGKTADVTVTVTDNDAAGGAVSPMTPRAARPPTR